MRVNPPKRSAWRNLSVVWLVPLMALVASLGIAWQNYADRGTLIEITFPEAAGIAEGETTLRYRDVVIGTVEKVGFTEDLAEVKVDVRVDNEVVPFLDDEATFWIVRPQVSARGISGLSTVLSGVYIAGGWDQNPGTPQLSFRGAAQPPLVQPGENGTRIVLRTNDGTSVSAGAPILYRGIEVGQLEQPRLTATGDAILIDAFIEAPHDRLVSQATRFWDASGFSVSLGTSGFQLDVDSLASLVTGGVSFETIYSGGGPIEAGQVFDLYPDEEEARRRPFLALDDNTVSFTVVFGESVSGLTNGADVTYRGLPVGQVRALRSELEQTEFGVVLGLKADIAIDPQRMGLPVEMAQEDVIRFFSGAVANGLRARLGASGLFGGNLIVELVEVADAPFSALDTNADPYPILPSVESDLPDFATTAQGVLDRLDALPIEDLLNQAISLMNAVEDVARAEGTRQAPDAVLALIEDTRSLIASEDTQAIPEELRSTINDLRTVVADLREQDAAQALTDALRSADQVAKDVSTATEGLPQLIADLNAVATKANGLAVEDLVASANRVLDNADALIADDNTRALPETLTKALTEVELAVTDARGIMGELREQGAVEALTNALRKADEVAADLSASTEGLPQLVEDLGAVAEKANALPLDELVASANRVLASADALVSSDDTKQLPVALTGALEQVEAALADLRAGGTVENVNETLASARDAADAIAKAASDLPELSTRLNQLVRQAETLVNSYGDRSTFNAGTLTALRDVSDAARAVSRLAREIERNPNSLLFGR
nr:MlaD family protein [Thalassococcus arenae]